MALPHEEIRKAVIGHTIELLEEQGLEAVKARPIASAAGISVGTFYNLFGNIDELLKQVNNHVMDQFQEFAREEIANRFSKAGTKKSDDPKAYLHRHFMILAEVYIDYIEANAKKWSAVLAFNSQREADEVDEHYIRQQQDLLSFIGVLLSDTEVGKDEVLLRKTARALWSSVHGIIVLNYLGWNSTVDAKQNCLQLIEIFVTYFVRGLFDGADSP